MDEKYAVIKMAAEHSKLIVEKAQFITSKSRNSIFIQFNFRTYDWNDMGITVIFNGQHIRVLDESCFCDIPQEALAEDGMLKVGVFGINGDTRINTNQVCFKVFEGSYNEGIPSIDISQTLYEQIMAALSKKVDKTITIAGIELEKHITKEELLQALNVQNGAEKNVQPDWNTTDENDPSFIKNKPTELTDKHYVHKQRSPSDVWIIVHNLNKYPSVHIEDSAHNNVIGEINYDNLNQLTIKFSSPFSGKAVLN